MSFLIEGLKKKTGPKQDQDKTHMDQTVQESELKETKKRPKQERPNSNQSHEIARIQQEFEAFKIEIRAQLTLLKPSITLPGEIQTALITLLDEQYKRFSKWRYGEKLKDVKKVAAFFQINLGSD